jgi:citrate synthase
MPTAVAAFDRLRRGLGPVPPDPELGHAENALWMLGGERPPAELVRGLETYLNTVIDHGLNASTFAARVIASTRSDLISAVCGALGALKGPLHGGAPGPALDLVREIGTAERAHEVLREKIAAGERLMGFGHRVYRVRDPRAEVLARAAARLYEGSEQEDLFELVQAVERAAVEVLAEHKPGRRLAANVELYTALLLHGLGLESGLFSPMFAISRTAGWLAHCFEQRRTGRLIRPRSAWVGEGPRSWVPLDER